MSLRTSSLPRPDGDTIFKLSCLAILFFPVFLRLPIGVGLRYMIVLRTLTLLPILAVLCVQVLYLRKRKIPLPFSYKDHPLAVLFFVIWGVAIVRTIFVLDLVDAVFVSYDLFTFVVVICLILFSFWLAQDGEAHLLRRCVILAFGVYVVLNLILYQLGIRPDYQIYLAEYPAQMLSIFGLSANRVLFPMTDGINYYGLLSGAILVAAVFLLPSTFLLPDRKWLTGRIVYGFVVLSCLASILMTDSRGALLFSLLTILIVVFFRRFSSILFWSVLVISITPVVATVIVPDLRFDMLFFLRRPHSNFVPSPAVDQADVLCETLLAESSGLLSNRPVIWKVVLEEMADPKIAHVIGYGFRGHVVSELSDHYSCIFKSYAERNLAAAHNVWLQLWVDTGYLGVGLTLVFVHSLIRRLADLFDRSQDRSFRSMQGVILYIVLIGSLEAAISPDFNMLFIFVCLISVISMFGAGSTMSKLEG